LYVFCKLYQAIFEKDRWMNTAPPPPAPAIKDAANIFALGQDAVLIRFGNGQTSNPEKALQFMGLLTAAHIAGVIEIAPSLASVQIRFAPDRITRAAVITALQTLLQPTTAPQTPPPPNRRWTIPVAFGGPSGPQLTEAATLAGITVARAVADLTHTPLTVLAIGFAPGQPYLGHLPENWGMPRQSALTPNVPAGAIVVAIRQIVLFANPSPTGWRWIGQSAFLPFDPNRRDPFALRPGDSIHFAPVDATTIDTLRANDPNGLGGATWEGAK
jgi:KipI family sensor histidine kinase inhibitor